MRYELTDYNGKSITITDEQANKISNIAGLIPVLVNGKIHHINKSNIASIKPSTLQGDTNDRQIDVPNNKGKASESKEKIRKMLKDKADLML